MYEIYFSVSLYGVFVFRTDVFDTAPAAERAEMALRAHFTKAGYDVVRYERLAAWTTTEVSSRG